MTIAQIELMAADCSITTYDHEKKKGDKSGKGGSDSKSKHEFKNMSQDEIDAKREAYIAKYGENPKPITISFKTNK